MSDKTENARTFTECFQKIYSKDPAFASSYLLTVFIGCYSMMEPRHRDIFLDTLCNLINHVGDEIFEDGSDLTSFLKEKLPTKGVYE